MGYLRAKKDTSVPKAYRPVYDGNNNVVDYETQGFAYGAGELVEESNVDPRVLERLDDGDEHLNSVLERVSDEDAAAQQQSEKEAGQLVRGPEHSVEAYVLASDPEEGYVLLSEQEVLEANVVEDAQEIQQAQKELVNDQVPAEADERSAIDFAADKGASDLEAGESQQPDDFVVETPSEPTPEPSPEPTPEPTPEPSPEGEGNGEPVTAKRGRKRNNDS